MLLDRLDKEWRRVQEFGGTHTGYFRQAIGLLAQEVDRLTALEESRATKPSSPAIESSEDRPSTSSTYFKTWHLVREGRNGESEITATVTCPDSSSTEERGNVLNPLLSNGFVLKTLTTWESPLPSGSTPSQTQEEAAAGQSAGGATGPESGGSREEAAKSEFGQFTDQNLLYAAVARCSCGRGLAHPLDSEASLRIGAWVCSGVLKGEVANDGHSAYPWMFYKIREETSINNYGALTTRPPGTAAFTVGKATCPKCGESWQSEPYVSCGRGHHWFGGSCPKCGYAVAADGSWSSSEGKPIEHRYTDVVMLVEPEEAQR